MSENTPFNPIGKPFASYHDCVGCGQRGDYLCPLHAAAPVLLEALRCVRDSGPLNNGLKDENTLTLVLEAIAQAEAR